MQQYKLQVILQEIMKKTISFQGKINQFQKNQIFEEDSLKAKIIKFQQYIVKKMNST
ncbi:unnamed protein product [Paramecium sonneborni]|uniref:Uncharacterized protein n=1 Tax=Paramecium sonneborni TaxID=65129 RepID=A0A8S1NL39_9CILI|nr:unnamed protein product [Paramecium sonneborni]